MIEGLQILTNEGIGTQITQKGFFKTSLVKIEAAACPNCGYIEKYLVSTEKLEQISKNKVN